MILINLISALLITQIIEAAIAWVLGTRERVFFITLILINIITNPILNLLLQLLFTMKLENVVVPALIVLEVVVVIVEWKLLSYTLGDKKGTWFGHAAAINLASFFVGVLTFGF